MTSKLKEGVMQGVFTLCACVSILAVALICIFLFANGVPNFSKLFYDGNHLPRFPDFLISDSR